MIKAVLFDMNGIIIDDEHIHEMAFAAAVKPFGIELDHAAYLQCCAGKTDRAGFEDISTTFGVTLPIDEVMKTNSDAYLELLPANKKGYPGVIELIHTLGKDFTLALTSSSLRGEVDLIIREFGITDNFKATISAADVTKGKPDPEPYLTTASKLGFSPEECAVIEDSKSGVTSAKAAGCFCIGVTTTHTAEDLKDADLIVDTFYSLNSQVVANLGK